jgi:hypothetical protein
MFLNTERIFNQLNTEDFPQNWFISMSGFITFAPKGMNKGTSQIYIRMEPCWSYSLRKLSSRAWRSASASLTAPVPPPPVAAAIAGAFAPLAASDPAACGKPDNWSVS